MSPPFIGNHITSGAAAGGAWMRAFAASEKPFIHIDALSCGPIKNCKTLEEWKDTRNSYLRSQYDDWRAVDEKYKTVDLARNAEKLKPNADTYLWLSTGLDEQLLLLFTTFLFRVLGIDRSRIWLVLYKSPANRKFPIRTMGELNPEQIAEHPTPLLLRPSLIEYCDQLWEAVTGSDPFQLEKECERVNSPLPRMVFALKYLLRRYPQKSTGLLYWDEKLLENVLARGPRAASIIGYTMAGDLHDADLIGDSYLFSRLHHLRDLPEPLVTLSGTTSTMKGTEVKLTNFGQSVLNKVASSFPTNSIDEWIGGVHLSTEQRNVWMYDNGKVVNGYAS